MHAVAGAQPRGECPTQPLGGGDPTAGGGGQVLASSLPLTSKVFPVMSNSGGTKAPSGSSGEGREGAVHKVTPQHTSGETGHQALLGWGAACTWGLARTTHQRGPAPLPPLTQAQAGCCGNRAPDHRAWGRACTPAGTSVLTFPRGPHR